MKELPDHYDKEGWFRWSKTCLRKSKISDFVLTITKFVRIYCNLCKTHLAHLETDNSEDGF